MEFPADSEFAACTNGPISYVCSGRLNGDPVIESRFKSPLLQEFLAFFLYIIGWIECDLRKNWFASFKIRKWAIKRATT